MRILDTKKYISTKTDIKYKFYDNDKYIGIILENKSDLNKFIKFLKDDKNLLFNQAEANAPKPKNVIISLSRLIT